MRPRALCSGTQGPPVCSMLAPTGNAGASPKCAVLYCSHGHRAAQCRAGGWVQNSDGAVAPCRGALPQVLYLAAKTVEGAMPRHYAMQCWTAPTTIATAQRRPGMATKRNAQGTMASNIIFEEGAMRSAMRPAALCWVQKGLAPRSLY